jgi:hypothetical protein
MDRNESRYPSVVRQGSIRVGAGRESLRFAPPLCEAR